MLKDIKTSMSRSDNKLFTETEIAERRGFTVATLRKRRLMKRPPPYQKIDGSVRYSPCDVGRYLAQQRIEPRRSV
jgi:hypothetical protein